jgi:acyl-CoA reductase-like NAD-dependent aldehyde dehydrogenase
MKCMEPLLLAGRWIETDSALDVRSPFTGELIAQTACAKPQHVSEALAAAEKALSIPLPEHKRHKVLETVANRLRERAEEFARTIALEAGKPIKTARLEVERAVSTLTFSAAEALRLSGETVPMSAAAAGAGKLAFTVHEPIGVVAAITPFNFPLNLVCHKVGPAVAAGCPVVLKPSSYTPLTALKLARLFTEAELPEGYLSVLPGSGQEVGDALVSDPRVALVTFTGSGQVGWSIAAKTDRKKVLLELGNSSPVLVFPDADISAAVAACVRHGFSHAGQSCISVQRILVHRSIYAQFLDQLVPAVEKLKTGDPLDEDTDVGPLITTAERDRVMAWIREAQDGGAKVLTGGTTSGPLLMPTVLADVHPSMKVSCLEVFGPLVAVTPFSSFEEGIELANGTQYGLQASVFTSNINTALKAVRLLRFGGVLVNEGTAFRADHMPYGGIKESGNTKEGPAYAVREMTRQKLIIFEGWH